MNTPYGSPDVEPDIAVSAEFTAPTEYTVKLKPGLKWANGHDLTASDVKFTFDRQLDDRGRERPVVAALQPGQHGGGRRHHGGLPPEVGERPDLPADPVQPRGPDRRRGGLLGRRADAGQRDRRRQRLRRSVHDHGLRLQLADLVRGEPGLRGRPAAGEDRRGQRQVLRRLVEPQAGHPGGQHRRRVPQPLGDGHRGPARRTTRSRSSTAPAGRSATSRSTSTRSRTAPRRTTPTRRRPSRSARPWPT